MTKKYEQTIQNLKAILLDPECKRMNPSIIKGYLGELIVKEKLESEIGEIEHKGNQSGYDLFIPQMDIKVDVKLSLFKNEIPRTQLKNWGWALQFDRHEGKIPACTHYVCVALNDKYEVDSFYIIDAKNLDQFQGRAVKRFNKVSRGFILTTLEMRNNIPEGFKSAFDYCHWLVENNTVLEVKPSQVLSEYFNI